MSITIRCKGDFKKIMERLNDIPKHAEAKIGVFDADIAEYAAYNEFGWAQQVTGRQSSYLRHAFGVNVREGNTLMSPPRPFLRATASAKAEQWAKTFRDGMAHGVPFRVALEAVARQAQVDIQQTIIHNGVDGGQKFPKRSPLTLAIYAAKDANTPSGRKRKIEGDSGSARDDALYKTGALLHAISYKLTEVK